MMKNYYYIVAIFLVLLIGVNLFNTYLKKPSKESKIDQNKALSEAIKSLPHQGILQENSNEFVYLKVDDAYIHRLIPLLKEERVVEPPHFRLKDSLGAHISVFYVKESKKIPHINEIGHTFDFEPIKIKTIHEKNKDVLVLQVKSSALEELRQKYGLSPKLLGHEFHITIGIIHRHQAFPHPIHKQHHHHLKLPNGYTTVGKFSGFEMCKN